MKVKGKAHDKDNGKGTRKEEGKQHGGRNAKQKVRAVAQRT